MAKQKILIVASCGVIIKRRISAGGVDISCGVTIQRPITAGAVAACGVIGFIGLIFPHIRRIFVGPDHRFLLPASCLCGSIFLVWIDTAARTLIYPTELPVGIITAMIGVPFFLILLRNRKKASGF